jgi:lipopolysaccharide/colanic/teichoic acid biosynthesis glycosyltransferase
VARQRPDAGLPRWVEATVAGAALIAAAPILLVTAAAVKFTSPGPLLFRQMRVGQYGEPFELVKFRTMRVGTNGLEVTAANDARVTRVGRILRKTKLDELPELYNVLRGDMSLVGPRPEVPRYVDVTHPLWLKVLAARPGLTDPTTVRLRNEEELLVGAEDAESFYVGVLQTFKLRSSAEYLERRNWRTDVGVLAETLLAVLLPGRASAPTIDELKKVSGAGLTTTSRSEIIEGNSSKRGG